MSQSLSFLSFFPLCLLYVGVLPAYVYSTTCVPGALGGQKVTDPLGLELEVVVRVLGTEPLSSVKAASILNC